MLILRAPGRVSVQQWVVVRSTLALQTGPAVQPSVFASSGVQCKNSRPARQPDVWALSQMLQFEGRQVGELALQVVALEYKYYKSNIASLFINLK